MPQWACHCEEPYQGNCRKRHWHPRRVVYTSTSSLHSVSALDQLFFDISFTLTAHDSWVVYPNSGPIVSDCDISCSPRTRLQQSAKHPSRIPQPRKQQHQNIIYI